MKMECVISHHRLVKRYAVRFMHEGGGPCQDEKVCYSFAACNWVADSIHNNALPTCPSCRKNILGLKYFENLTEEEKQEKPLTGRVDKQYPEGRVGQLSRLLTMKLESKKELSVEEMFSLKDKAIEAQKPRELAEEDDDPCVYVRLFHAAQRTGIGNIVWALGAVAVIGAVTVFDSIMGPPSPAEPLKPGPDFQKTRVK